MKKRFGIGILAVLSLLFVTQSCFYSPRYIYRVIAWQDADYDDFKKFKFKKIQKSSVPFQFHDGTQIQSNEVIQKFEQDTAVSSLKTFLASTKTRALLVIRNDTLLYQYYGDNNGRSSLQTSFSVSKSILSLLMGRAIEKGLVSDINEPITTYLPELKTEDERFENIQIKHLLQMRSGLAYSSKVSFPFVTADDPKTYYHPDLRKVAIGHSKIETNPGLNFKYNNYNALLIGLILERATNMSVSKFLENQIWQPIGAQYDATWSTDEHEFEKMESGLNAAAIDFAKIGRLTINEGFWQGTSILDSNWIKDATQSKMDSTYRHFSNPKYWTYNYFWWGIPEKNSKSDYMAIGNYGQILYVSPRTRTIIVRNGEEAPPYDDGDWIFLFQNFVER